MTRCGPKRIASKVCESLVANANAREKRQQGESEYEIHPSFVAHYFAAGRYCGFCPGGRAQASDRHTQSPN
jgi:hypothetical protein